MFKEAISGEISGALAGASFGPAGIAIGAGLGAAGGILAANSKKKAAKARASMLEKQAQRRLQQGQEEARNIFDMGQRDSTQYLSQSLSSGRSRSSFQLDMGLETIATRAANELTLALNNAEYEAELLRMDAQATRSNASQEQTADYINIGSNLLRQYGEYSNRETALGSAQQRTGSY